MKILHAANFSLYPPRKSNLAYVYAPARAVHNGLNRNGHCVLDFSVDDTTRFHRGRVLRGCWSGRAAMNALLLKTTRCFAPDLLLLGHARQVTSATLHAVREALPRIRIVQWWVDSLHPERAKALTCIKRKLPFLDAFFCTTEAAYAARILGDTAERIHFFPNICDGSVYTHRSFARREHRYDLIYIGRPAASRQSLVARLRELAVHYRVGIYGQTQKTQLNSASYLDVVGHSQMGVNYSLHNNEIPLYSSDRMIHLLGNGVLTFCPRVPGMESCFSEEEVVYFKDLDEFQDKFKEYLACADKTRATARAGWEKAHRVFNEVRVTRFLLETAMGRPYSEDYEWPTRRSNEAPARADSYPPGAAAAHGGR